MHLVKIEMYVIYMRDMLFSLFVLFLLCGAEEC